MTHSELPDPHSPAPEYELPTASGEALSPEFRQLLEVKHAETARLLKRIGLETPSLRELASGYGGINFDHLETAHAELLAAGLQPEVVIAPVITQDQWMELFKDLAQDPELSASGVIGNTNTIDRPNLYPKRIIDDYRFNIYTKPPTGTGKHISKGEPWYAYPHQTWTAVVIDGSPLPTALDVNSFGKAPDSQGLTLETNKAHRNPYFHEYLMLQAQRAQAGQAPLDAEGPTETWLSGGYYEPHHTSDLDAGGEFYALTGTFTEHGGVSFWPSVDTSHRTDIGIRYCIAG